MTQQPESEEFYTELFTESADWSTTYPNAEEARRAARILPLLSQVAEDHRARVKRPQPLTARAEIPLFGRR